VYLPEDTRAEEHQQPKTGLPGSLCQRLLGNHGRILRDPAEYTATTATTFCGYRGRGAMVARSRGRDIRLHF
jgi:hypothetical protein